MLTKQTKTKSSIYVMVNYLKLVGTIKNIILTFDLVHSLLLYSKIMVSRAKDTLICDLLYHNQSLAETHFELFALLERRDS